MRKRLIIIVCIVILFIENLPEGIITSAIEKSIVGKNEKICSDYNNKIINNYDENIKGESPEISIQNNEEELGLDISRNSMGHRIYTDDDLKTFRAIKQLKANHVALKEIRQQIVVSGEKTPLKKDCEKEFCGDKMTQFKSILSNIIL